MSTKGIILTSFGSIYGDAVEKSVGSMEQRIMDMYPDCIVRRVFLSEALIQKWNDKYDTSVQSLHEAMEEMHRLNVSDLYIQPFALVADQSYQQLRKEALKYIHGEKKMFNSINIGKPLLHSLGVKNYTDDYVSAIEAITKHLNVKAVNKTILLMANGQNQLEFSTLQLKCLYEGYPHMAVFTSNGFPNFKHALSLIEQIGNRDVIVVPLALIGSIHLLDYLGGDRPDSISTLLLEKGYNVSLWNEGLGENPYIQELFLRHLTQIIRLSERSRKSAMSPNNQVVKTMRNVHYAS